MRPTRGPGLRRDQPNDLDLAAGRLPGWARRVRPSAAALVVGVAMVAAMIGCALPDRAYPPVTTEDVPPVSLALPTEPVPEPSLAEVDLVVAAPLIVVPTASFEDPFEAQPTPVRSFSTRGNRSADLDAELPRWQPTAVPTPRVGVSAYRVVSGDSVVELAARFGISPATIVRANALADAEKLAIGQVLRIPPVSGRLHVVREGETILALAERYGVIPEAIAAVNRLDDADLIRPDQELVIPMSAEAERAAAEAEAAPPKPLVPIKHQVTSGESLNGIAARYGVSPESIRRANDLANADFLKPGQDLIVPPVAGILHRTAPGDTLIGVASRYEAGARDIIRANGLVEPYLLRLGEVLVVPGGRFAPASASAVSPATGRATTEGPARTDTLPAPSSRAVQPAKPVPPPVSQPAAPPAAIAVSPAGRPNSSIADLAARFLGAPYVWGGTTPAGFDCSGFVMYVLRQAGIPVPRDLWGQLQAGRRVSRAELRPGDIVFFQNTYMPGLSHNGVYIGGGRFISAASESTGVITSRLDDGYWGPRYLGATRVGG